MRASLALVVLAMVAPSGSAVGAKSMVRQSATSVAIESDGSFHVVEENDLARQQATAPAAETPESSAPSSGSAAEEFGCAERVCQAKHEACKPFGADEPSPRVLLTGGAGFIGSHLVKGLRRENVTSIKIIDNLWRGSLSNLCNHECECDVDLAKDFCFADLTDRRAIAGLFENVEVIYHLADVLAGISFVFQNEHWLFQQNLLINANVMQEALRVPSVKEYIYVGSACSFPLELQSSYEPVALREDQTYPAHPESAYGWSKLMGEYEASLVLKMEEAKRHGLNVGVLRFHNVYGPRAQYADKKGSQALPALVRKAISYPNLELFEVWGSSRQYRDFVFVEDVVRALLRIRQSGMNEGVIQIGTGEAVTLQRAAAIIQSLTQTCLGKAVQVHSQTSELEGDSGRVAVRDRAQQLMHWEAEVYIEEGLARLYQWILGDMQRRGAIRDWMLGNGTDVGHAASCLQAEAAAARRSKPRDPPKQVTKGVTVWRAAGAADQPQATAAAALLAAPTTKTLLEQLPLPHTCDHQGPVKKPATNKTLVVVICSTRGRHLTWRNFHDNVLEPLQADLALSVSSETVPDSETNSFRAAAKYVWLASPPPDNDYWHWYHEIAQLCFQRNFTLNDAEVVGHELSGTWLGLIKATKQQSASSVLIFFRWLALMHMERLGLLSQYSHIIITRSDYFYTLPHPQVSSLQPGTIMAPRGEGYGGITDRHTVLHVADAPRLMALAEKVVFAPGEQVVKRWMENINLERVMQEQVMDQEKRWWNLERVMQHWYVDILKLNVTKFGHVAFLVYDSEDASVQRWGRHSKNERDPYVALRVSPKYYSEYNEVMSVTLQGPQPNMNYLLQ